jgi:hypothetical protein
MNYYVLHSCYMQRIKLINPVTGDTIPGSERGYGFFARETDYGLESDFADCSRYTSQEYDLIFDGWMQSARFFAFVSMFLGGIAFLVLFSSCMCAFSANMFERWLLWGFILAGCATGLMFLVFGSEHCKENHCKVAAGSGYAISAFMFWLSTANTVKSMGGAMPKSKNNNRRRNRNNKNEEDEDDVDDLYYEDDSQKYPLPETTPEGRKRYADAEEYANDTEKAFDRRFGNGEDDSSDEDDHSYGDEEEDYSGGEDDVLDNDDEKPFKGDKKQPKASAPVKSQTSPQQELSDFHDEPHFETTPRQMDDEYYSEDPYANDGTLSHGADIGEKEGFNRKPRVGNKHGPTLA